jgi:hypothetical protein
MSVRLKPSIVWGLAFVILAPWLIVQGQAMLNGNVSWLLIAAERMATGQSQFETIYETNPPLSIIIYIPHILFSYLFRLDIPTGATALTSILIILSSITTLSILKNFNFLTKNDQNSLFFGTLSSITIITAIYFMDREHLMMLVLIPFILCQFALTYGIAVPKRLLWPVLALASVMLLVKPHYVILPAVFFCHRMYVQRKLNIIFDPDFIALLTGGVIYALVLVVFYQDYLNIILPDVLNYYLPMKDKYQTLRFFKAHFSAYIAFLCLELFMEDLEKPKKRLVIYLYICALLSLIPLLVQLKGFYNHLMPAFGFFVMGLSLTISFRAEKYMKICPPTIRNVLPVLTLLLSILVIRPSWNYPKGTEVSNMTLARYLDEQCSQPCSFFIFHGDIEIVNPTALYKNYTHASRFPSYWFIPTLLQRVEKAAKDNNKSSSEHLKKEIIRFSSYVEQDLKKYRPSLLLIGTNIDVFGNGRFFDYVTFFSVNNNFKREFQDNYSKTGTFEFDRAEYFRGTSLAQSYKLKYDVYVRNTK